MLLKIKNSGHFFDRVVNEGSRKVTKTVFISQKVAKVLNVAQQSAFFSGLGETKAEEINKGFAIHDELTFIEGNSCRSIRSSRASSEDISAKPLSVYKASRMSFNGV
jgi:hypothetical protein